jgi:uncharacterized protein (TIGR03084 family)
MLLEAADFGTESEILNDLLVTLAPADWARPTGFKGWTVRDVIAHLHFWNGAADLSLHDGEAFKALYAKVSARMARGRMRDAEDAILEDDAPRLEDEVLRAHWLQRARDIAGRWTHADPKTRVPWAGPSMSARSSITARHMETWAHGHEIFDLFAQTRAEGDRIRNIVVLGVNTFGWTHKVHGPQTPATAPATAPPTALPTALPTAPLAARPAMPKLTLTAPSGARWDFGDETAGRIEGPALGFAQAVTQTRHWRETDLRAEGDGAIWWLDHAQCFAGAPMMPPAPGMRVRAAERPD